MVPAPCLNPGLSVALDNKIGISLTVFTNGHRTLKTGWKNQKF